MIALCHRLEEWNRLHGEINMVLFDIGGVEGENMKGPALSEGRNSRAGQKREQVEVNKRRIMNEPFLGSYEK